MQIQGLHPSPVESESLGVGSSTFQVMLMLGQV